MSLRGLLCLLFLVCIGTSASDFAADDFQKSLLLIQQLRAEGKSAQALSHILAMQKERPSLKSNYSFQIIKIRTLVEAQYFLDAYETLSNAEVNAKKLSLGILGELALSAEFLAHEHPSLRVRAISLAKRLQKQAQTQGEKI